MTVNFRGYLFQDDGDAVSGATVQLLETGTTTVEATTTTDSDGLWYVTESDQDRYDVKITSGTSVRYIRWDDQVSFKELDIRNNTGATTPAATFTNITNNAANQVAVFSGANSTKADSDEIYLSFKLADSAGNIDEFARMTVVATDVTSGSEDGQFEFDVMKGGSLIKAFTIASSAAGAQSIDFNQDSITFGTGTAATDITLTFDAESADGVITWMEDEDYFKFSDDILMATTERINLRDTAIYIYSSTDGQLDLVADTEIQIASTTIDINGAVAFDGALTGITNITLTGTLSDGNYTFDTSGNVSGLGTIGSGAITSTSTVQGTTITATTAFVPDASDGAALGTTSLEFSDLYLADGAVVGFGDDQEVTLTHVHDAGLLLSSTDKLQFGDSGTFIHQSADGVLTIESDTTVDVNGAVVFDGALSGITTIGSGAITSTGVVTATGFTIGNAAILEAELEILDGATVTTTELNLIDGGTVRGTTAVASGDGILINDNGTMSMTNVDTVSTYFASHNVGGGNIVTTGALDSGSITSGFGSIDNGSSAITTTGTITGGALAVDNISLNANAITTTSGNLTASVPAGSDVLIGDNVTILFIDGGGNNVGIGEAPNAVNFLDIQPDSGDTIGNEVSVRGTFTGSVGSALTGLRVAPTIVEAGSGTHASIASISAVGPTITAGGAATTIATSILVSTAPTGGTNNYLILDNTNTAYLSTGGVWTDTSQRAAKMNITAADTSALTTELRSLNIRQYKRRQAQVETITVDGLTTTETSKDEAGETVFLDEANLGDPNLHYGLIADEAPDCFKDSSGRGVSAGYVSGFLLGVVQNLDARITALGG